MATFRFRLPDVGEGVAEAEIVAWHVKVGDPVREDQNLVDVMTDKATVEITSPVDGTVTSMAGEIGAMLPVGTVLVELEIAGEGEEAAEAAPQPSPEPGPSAQDPLPPEEAGDPPHRPEPDPGSRSPSPQQGGVTPAQNRGDVGDRQAAAPPLAAPATRRRAIERGVALGDVTGTGRGGRITPEDVEAFAAARSAPEPHDGITEVRIVGLRRRIAEKMQEAKRRIPHITYVEECDVTELEALRAALNTGRGEGRPKLTLLPFLIRALVRTLPDFPQVNARYDDEAGVLRTSAAVHVGIATQAEAGLMVPVIRDAQALDVWECARAVTRVATAARDGSAPREMLSGSTITLSSLGPLGGIVSTPVINHPEVAIIAPNRIVERPVVNGAFVSIRKVMNLSSSFDHRIVDGHDAASFVQALRRRLEHPALIFMD